MDDRQARRVRFSECLELVLEDDGFFVAVGIQQRDAAASLGQHRAQDGKHRRDAAAAGQQQKVAIERARMEHAGRHHHLDGVASADVVANPVGAAPAGDALDRDARRVVHTGRARHGVAARHMAPVDAKAQRQELARLVGKGSGQIGWHIERHRLGVVGFVHHGAYAQRMVSAHGKLLGSVFVAIKIIASSACPASARDLFCMYFEQAFRVQPGLCSVCRLTAPCPEWRCRRGFRRR